ncbi:MAG: hypothetical protein D6681_02765, partial [Calditrichaeota bacterium]
MTIRFYRLFFLLFGVLLIFGQAHADQQRNRAIIDSLRWGFDYKSAEAYRRAKQAQHLDSTYYVGYLIEAFHFFERAEEQSGLRKAVEPLQKALARFEKEFGYCLNKRYTLEDIFMGAWREMLRQLDYLTLASTLIDCYFSLEMPDSAYSALMRLKNADLAIDFRSYQGLAWLYFRSRIYTSKRYPFLKDSIEENIRMAFRYADSLEWKYRQEVPYFRREILRAYPEGGGFHAFFKGSFVDRPPTYVANIRGILYGYNLKTRTAVSFFKKLDDEDSVAKFVNLGYSYYADIDFRNAEHYFANVPDRGSKTRGGHWQGFSAVYVYKGHPLEGAAELQQKRDQHGYTIGYGWDNLCLARMYLYAGYVDQCATALNNAEHFTEVHYNSSFREDQYRFMLKTLRMMEFDYRLKAKRFENRHRWLSWEWWKAFPKLAFLKFKTVYQLANELALNPEREIVFYHIFHTENIITFDELWNILRHYDLDYFWKVLTRNENEDPRPNLHRYYEYFLGRILQEKGENDLAYDRLTAILRDPDLNQEYEKLLIARIHESCARIAEAEGWEPQQEFHLNMLYYTYPQLIPFSDVRMRFRLHLAPELRESPSPAVQQALDQLRACNIDFDPPENRRYPEVYLALGQEGTLEYQVMVNQDVFTRGRVRLDYPDAGKRLAYR